MFGNGLQEVLLHLPKDHGEPDWPVIPGVLLFAIFEDRSDICFPPVLRSLPELPWPFKDKSGLTVISANCLSIQGCIPWGPIDFRAFSLYKCSLTWSVSLTVSLLWSGFPSWPHGPAIPESKSDWGKVSVEDFGPLSPSPVPLLSVLQTSVCVCVCVYLWAPFQTNKPEFCADFPDKLFLFVAQDVSQFPQWASNSIPGEVQLGWKQRQQYTFFFGFLITSVSVSEAFFLKILNFAGVASQTFSHHNFSYHL